jgi:folate-binding protein YgfZ
VIRARGDEAVKFLHSQLTQDIEGLALDRARTAGFCSAKGRLQASFTLWLAAPTEVMLACSADLLAPTLKRLSMFVLRSKCKLEDVSDQVLLYGLVGDEASAWLGASVPRETMAVRAAGEAQVVRLATVRSLARYLLAAPASAAAPPLSTIDVQSWNWLEVQSGVPRIVAATVDQFVPQMINFDLVGGVNFQKGCYPGQEVVARSQYRGTLKRRAMLFDCDAAATAGQEVFHSADLGQPAGQVVNAASGPDPVHWSALVEVKLAALAGGSLHLGAPDGPVLRPCALPYPLPAGTS